MKVIYNHTNHNEQKGGGFLQGTEAKWPQYVFCKLRGLSQIGDFKLGSYKF